MSLSEKQMAFNAAWRGLKWQGFEQCRDDEGMCLIEGLSKNVEGRVIHCAVGWMLPPEVQQRAPGFRAESIPEEHPLKKALTYFPLWLRDLQGAHDSGTTPPQMERNLRDYAKKHNLKIPTDWKG